MIIFNEELVKSIEGTNRVEEVSVKAPTRAFVKVTPENNDIEFLIEVTLVYPDNSFKDSLPRLWKKHGLMDRVLDSYTVIQTYLTTEEGCFGVCNPTVTGAGKINFDRKTEVTEESIKDLIERSIKCYRERAKKIRKEK